VFFTYVYIDRYVGMHICEWIEVCWAAFDHTCMHHMYPPSSHPPTHIHTPTHSLSMVLPLEESLTLLEEYDTEFKRAYEGKMRAKLGLLGEGGEDGDAELFKVCVCI
jgi:hypothetical protein